jgi:hypothetical protein
MRRIFAVFIAVLISAGAALAADAEKAPAAAITSAPAGETEAAKRWKGIKAQEEWVARLKKQIQGETSQLSEMRAALADAFKLDVKKLEAGLYDYDEKTDKFTEKKPA